MNVEKAFFNNKQLSTCIHASKEALRNLLAPTTLQTMKLADLALHLKAGNPLTDIPTKPTASPTKNRHLPLAVPGVFVSDSMTRPGQRLSPQANASLRWDSNSGPSSRRTSNADEFTMVNTFGAALAPPQFLNPHSLQSRSRQGSVKTGSYRKLSLRSALLNIPSSPNHALAAAIPTLVEDKNEERRKLFFYKIPSSDRLKDVLLNRNHRDVKAAVGSYTPHPLEWTKPNKKGEVKDKWSLTGPRFPKEHIEDKFGPGFYASTLPKKLHQNGAQSAFRSKISRFPETKTSETSIAPGTYDMDPKPPRTVPVPWIRAIHAKLGRKLDAGDPVSYGTPSALLEKLSVETSLPTFLERKKKFEESSKPNERELLPPPITPQPKVQLHPYSAMYLVPSNNAAVHE